MKTLTFEDNIEFSEMINALVLEKDDETIAVIANNSHVNCLVKELIKINSDYYFADINFSYDNDNYVVEIGCDDFSIWVTPIDNNNISIGAETVFINENCNSKYLQIAKFSNAIYEYILNDDYNESCDMCDYLNNDEDVETYISENGITQSYTDGNGNYFSRSFMSSNDNQLNMIIKEWTDFANKIQK